MTVETIIWNPRYAIMIALQEDGEKQWELAERIGWDPSRLSRLVSGKTKRVDVRDLQVIAKAQSRPLSYYVQPPTQAMGVYLSSLAVA